MRRLLALAAVWLTVSASVAQTFYELTDDELAIDSVLPTFHCSFPLPANYGDSVYSVSIEYPEWTPMTDDEIRNYRRLTDNVPGEKPAIRQFVTTQRRQSSLHVSFTPIVMHDNSYQKLSRFAVRLTATAANRRQAPASRQAERAESTAADGRYAEHSVLATGRWAKIRVPATGIYQLTDALARQAGFTSLAKVKIYGYGGARQPEKLTADYLAQTDDLKEVATCNVGGRRLFYAVGPVTWSNNKRVRNPYSSYGYYFMTESDGEPLTVSDSAFVAANYPTADNYNSLYEVDDYAWFEGGCNLYDSRTISAGGSREYTVPSAGSSAEGSLTVAITADAASTAAITLNGKQLSGTVSVSNRGTYDAMRTGTATFTVDNLQEQNTVKLTTTSGSGTVRLDYISIHSDEPGSAPQLNATFPTPEYVYNITNQDHHAATAADMIIIIPTTQKLLAQARQLKELHEQYDSLRVGIVPADELFNEFSSGTPDANAYRRYLKMLYDRAESEADMPKFLLLLGDGVWDNRMLVSDWRLHSPDDFLLCYESENSYSKTDCYVSDDYFCMLDDNEGGNLQATDVADIAVGRISARTAEQAQVVVDKIRRYVTNEEAGAWQNTVCFMGDDGNQNQHMMDADSVAQMVEQLYPDLLTKRIMWDAYTQVSTSTGNRFPDVTRLIKKQMQQGALLMNYSGHGGPNAFSHEYALTLADFEEFTSPRLPLWVTASCELMPFDGTEENVGETALFKENGSAVAFYGTTRTVYQSFNRLMNLAFTRHVLSRDDNGRPIAIGEAVRRAKAELMTTGIVTYNSKGQPVNSRDISNNKLQYTLLGDPAVRLALPTMTVSVDSINGVAAAAGTMTLKAGSTATLCGHVTDGSRTLDDFSGVLTTTVRDAAQQIVCRLNDTSASSGADDPFVFTDRQTVIYNGSDSVAAGRFKVTFVVPKDISYSDAAGMVNFHAVNSSHSLMANGCYSNFVMNGSEGNAGDNCGPAVFCYLNNSGFTNGGKVNNTPYFVAQISDEDGINASGAGIGHDLQLIIDGAETTTYNLNDYFQFDFGSYTNGTVGFSIPTLSYGTHRLLFRAWDVLNNSTTTELTFDVVKGLQPVIADVECTHNPATTSTSFRITHDRTGSTMNVVIDVFDTAGRQLWSHSENGTSEGSTYTVDWNLTTSDGRRLDTGLYLYRVRISTEGSTYASKARKLIIL